MPFKITKLLGANNGGNVLKEHMSLKSERIVKFKPYNV